MHISYLDIWSMLLYGQVPHTSNSNHLFWDLKDPALVQTLHYRRKIIYQPLRIGFFHRLISVQDIGHMLHLNVAQQLPKFIHQWVISYLWQRYWAEQAISICHWSKQNISSKNKSKEAWRKIFTTYIRKRSIGIHSLAVDYVLDWWMFSKKS